MQTDLQLTEQPAAILPAAPKRLPFAAVSEHKHIQAAGMYVKATFVRKNVKFYSKKLPTDHITILAAGEMIVIDGDTQTRYSAPASYAIPADTRIMCYSVTDCVYYCVHATDVTDLAQLKELY
jgi:hypothetical protein